MMRSPENSLKIVSVYDGYEQAFWNHVNLDPLDYFFFILDLKQHPENTKVLLAIEGERIQGLMLVYSDLIVQLRGMRRAVEKLLDHVNLEKINLQAPLDCEDLVTRRYNRQIRHELVLMTLKKGDEKLQIKEKPVRLGPENALEVAKLMKEADPEWWGEITLEDRKQSLEETFWVGLKHNGRIVSVGNARFNDLGSNIGVIATDERYRNMGYATSIVSTLVEEILKRSPSALIHVLSENAPAIRVYSKVGYRPYKRYLLVRAERIKT
jgi:ribosomal protein S18 acetylase RimI-like enzyme